MMGVVMNVFSMMHIMTSLCTLYIYTSGHQWHHDGLPCQAEEHLTRLCHV